jgi:hypothetical protein
MRNLSVVVDARSDQRATITQRAEREDFLPFIVDARPNQQASVQIAKTIVENGWGLSNLTPLPMTLEEIFLELTTEENLGE